MKNKNPVAKYCFEFNKPKVEKDKTKYNKKVKHCKKSFDFSTIRL